MSRRRLVACVGLAALLAGLAGLVGQGCAKPRPSVQQVLSRMAQAYRDCRALRETARMSLQITRAGQVAPPPVAAELQWTFAQPNRIRYQVTGFRPFTVVADGEKVYTALPAALQYMVSPQRGQLSDLPSLQFTTGAGVGITELRLLEGDDPAGLLSEVRLRPKDALVEGVWCYVLSGRLPADAQQRAGISGGRQEIWVGRQDGLIRQSIVRLEKAEERPVMGAQPAAKAEPLRHFETLVVKVLRVQTNPVLPNDAFAFTPPAIYRAVTNLLGKPFPSLTLPDLQGRPVSFARFRGKEMLLVFWASWQPYSVYQLTAVQEFRARHPGAGLVVLTASLDMHTDDAQNMLRTNKIFLPTLMAGGDLEPRVAPLDVSSLPRLFFIDGGGVVREVITHIVTLSELEAAARAAGFKL